MPSKLRVLLIEPFFGGSHRSWADAYQKNSRHDVQLLTLPAQFWKWRMQGGAVTLARFTTEQNLKPDVILASDMFNVATYKALAGSKLDHCPIALYFHESQLSYPQNSRQSHGWRYGFINYVSALAADQVFFNSPYHLKIFFKTLPNMLKHFGDNNELETIESLRKKSSVLPLGLDLQQFDHYHVEPQPDSTPVILWNHRWEDDKNPKLFLRTLYKLADEGFNFKVAILGENVRKGPAEFEKAAENLGDRVIAFGYQNDFADYARTLWQSTYVVSTAHQEFFGSAVAEAIYCNCIPILPNRLNYPNLIPQFYHSQCLYKGNALFKLVSQHLQKAYAFDTSQLRQFIQQFDWQNLAATYDEQLENLAQSTR